MKRKTSLKVQRVFSEELKKEIVSRIESGLLTVRQAQREYDISSGQTVYRWLYKFSRNLKKGTRLVMEKDSNENSVNDLRKQIKELEAALGRKTLEADLPYYCGTGFQRAQNRFKKKFWRSSIEELKGIAMEYSFKTQLACQILGYSRQAYYKGRNTANLAGPISTKPFIEGVKKVRKGNPSKGCRAIYEQEGHKWPLGRDKSIELLMSLGHRVKYPKSYGRATQAGSREFANLLVDKTVRGINQVWQADMAYYLHGEKPFYTIYITDVYSQEIVGYGAYSTTFAINYVEVLKAAIKRQKNLAKGFGQLIHHSDGGKQYESMVYKNTCEKHRITQSMCMYSYENPYAEKTNDLVNNGYLNIWRPKTLEELRRLQRSAVQDHNRNSRKKVLEKRSPLEFKKWFLENNNQLESYRLKLKPVAPEQPRKIKSESINV